MKPSIAFITPGLIDIRALQFMGVSSKENDNPIGFFGTGLKYAIAILLRERHEVVMWRGPEKYTFEARRETFRKDEFDFIYMNGQPLGITTHLGATWELWQAFRELYSNTLDEKGAAERIGDEARWGDGDTAIIVTGDKFSEVFDARDQFFIATDPLVTIPGIGSIHPGESQFVFFRGVRAMKMPKNSSFTYNISRGLTLTEDRTIQYQFQVHPLMAKMLLLGKNREVIEAIVTAKKVYECDIGEIEREDECSPEFLEVMHRLISDREIDCNSFAKQYFWRKTRRPKERITIDLTKIEDESLHTAIKFCRAINYPVDDYPIKTVEHLGEGMYGEAKDGTIWICREALRMGTKFVASTLIEEWVHLRYGHPDHSQAMQLYLFNQIVHLGEELIWKKPL